MLDNTPDMVEAAKALKGKECKIIIFIPYSCPVSFTSYAETIYIIEHTSTIFLSIFLLLCAFIGELHSTESDC